MDNVYDLSVIQVALGYVFLIFVYFIVKKRKIKREKKLLIAAIRMTLQLILVGFLLGYIFDNPNPFITILIILIMEAFAIYTVYSRFKNKLTIRLKKVIAFSIVSGTATCLIYFLFIVIRIKPWYNPQYFIPIAGMLIGNSMTGISLGINSLVENMKNKKDVVEEALILGAKPTDAVREIVNNAFDEAILPTINSMIGMGIVFLPGMMTGQILAGTSPVTAIAYQIAIMLGILGSVSLTVLFLLKFGTHTYFNSLDQLID